MHVQESEDALLDIKRPSQKAALAQSIAQQKQAVKLLQQRFQTALVTARKAIKTKAQNDRESLLALGSASKTDRSNAAAIQASNDITYGLKQAVQMISAEVERSIETVNTLGNVQLAYKWIQWIEPNTVIYDTVSPY
ncbi:hypothetical protein BDEG_21235 [Batrachochytrium dendrobatidis JEL423]|uniref:Uncharacterized protein n=1 Tax=Batrachochytrium dendrobatidis (strain JEL423) TaxID=403673 RepID=A0A177WBQ3_BATDL|nr:hypothetical protein BDEG_21235 [Batrachochytrium dendrobatidis JEL423]